MMGTLPLKAMFKMTKKEEEKKEETPEETPKEETPEPIEEQEEEVLPDEEKEEEIDYEAIEKEEEGKKKPDPVRAKIAKKERDAKREDEEEEEEKPLTRQEALDILSQGQQQTQKTIYENSAVAIAATISGSESEARAIVAKWRNRVFPEDMPIQEQIEEMSAIINRKKNVSKTKEMARALQSKDNVSKDVAGTHRDAPQGSEPKLSASDAKGIKSAGYVWDGTKRLWKKPMPGGKKFLYMKDLKSGTWIE